MFPVTTTYLGGGEVTPCEQVGGVKKYFSNVTRKLLAQVRWKGATKWMFLFLVPRRLDFTTKNKFLLKFWILKFLLLGSSFYKIDTACTCTFWRRERVQRVWLTPQLMWFDEKLLLLRILKAKVEKYIRGNIFQRGGPELGDGWQTGSKCAKMLFLWARWALYDVYSPHI